MSPGKDGSDCKNLSAASDLGDSLLMPTGWILAPVGSQRSTASESGSGDSAMGQQSVQLLLGALTFGFYKLPAPIVYCLLGRCRLSRLTHLASLERKSIGRGCRQRRLRDVQGLHQVQIGHRDVSGWVKSVGMGISSVWVFVHNNAS